MTTRSTNSTKTTRRSRRRAAPRAEHDFSNIVEIRVVGTIPAYIREHAANAAKTNSETFSPLTIAKGSVYDPNSTAVAR
jgi:hypothetical protein